MKNPLNDLVHDLRTAIIIWGGWVSEVAYIA